MNIPWYDKIDDLEEKPESSSMANDKDISFKDKKKLRMYTVSSII